MKTFTLTFTEAMEVLKQDKGWIQGEGFSSKCVITNDKNMGFILTDFKGYRDNVILTKRLMLQNFRVVQFQSELN